LEKTISKIKETGIENTTIVIFVGDNGTSDHIAEYADGDSVSMGGKWSTTEAGTHVPMIACWPGTISGGTVNNDLIDFTDFLPTLAGIADIPVPTDYGPLDGVSFYPRLMNKAGHQRVDF
jgi:arylsulfatase A-like enzyme